MKSKYLGLQNSVTSSYDKTKTTVQGRDIQKTINSELVIGPPLTKFIDSYTDTANTFIPQGPVHYTDNNRLFVINAPVAAVPVATATIAMYSFNKDTGAKTFVGRIQVALPSAATTTHTVRKLVAYDGASEATLTGWKIVISTIGAVAINGGTFVVNNIGYSDFVSVPSLIYPAVASNTKAVYFSQDPAGLGAANNQTTIMGGMLDRSTGEYIVANGTAASFTMFGHDLTQTPTITTQTTTAATANGSPTFTLTAHGYALNDIVVITSNPPTPFTASSSIVHTPYFIKNPTANTFELSTTLAAASTNCTSVTSNTVFARAFGTTTSFHMASRKTGTIAIPLAGTALLTDAQHVNVMSEPTSPNFNQKVYVFPTTTQFYNFRLTDISAGATTLPSLQTVNVTGTGTDVLAITPTFMQYSSILNAIVYSVATFSFMMKRWVNSQLIAKFGGQVNTWLENIVADSQMFRMSAIAGMEVSNGWMFITSLTAGQRGIMAIDLRSDTLFDHSYFVSPVVNLGAYPSIFNFISTIEELYNITDTSTFYYRTAATESDAIFNSISGGWNLIDTNADLSSVNLLQYIQIKGYHDVTTLLSGTPNQIKDVAIGYTPITDMSDNWEGSVDNSSRSSESPTYVSFRLINAYPSTVPTLYVRGVDDSGNIAQSFNTSANASDFNYSTNNGTSWNTLGVIPNTVLTTEVRLQVPSPSGAKLTWTISES